MKQKCVTKFRVYDISSPTRKWPLFTVAVPLGATGLMKTISATSQELIFVVGQHRIGVAAGVGGGERNRIRCFARR